MNHTVYRYPFDLAKGESQDIDVPKGAEFLSVVSRYGNIDIYAAVDPDESEKDSYTFTIVPTGVARDAVVKGTFLGTVMSEDKKIVFHVFYQKNS